MRTNPLAPSQPSFAASGTNASPTGLLYALAACMVWGFFPIYIKALAAAGPMEVVCHRVLWSVPVAALMVSLRRGWGPLRQALRAPRVVASLAGSALFIAVNWLGYVYAVESGQVLQGSLGYFIYPLVSALLGRVFLGERLRRGQALSVLLALAGTLTLALGHGQPPWLALFLACSFGIYGLLRKQVAMDAVGGLLVETSLLAPLALAGLLWLGWRGELALFTAGWGTKTLLLAAGVATSLPLVWFTRAARRMSLTALGMCTYLGPTLQFLLAVFLYKETFTPSHLLSFGLIWAGLAVFTAETFYQNRKERLALARAAAPHCLARQPEL